ncbi:hypothetical protein BGX28_001741 [Mortierella sp. GBA30]|nr:hypothetical protein BGX28_001741 [Mortierella sp. GBA30]
MESVCHKHQPCNRQGKTAFCSELSVNDDSGRAYRCDGSEMKVLRFSKDAMCKSTIQKYLRMNPSRDVRTP